MQRHCSTHTLSALILAALLFVALLVSSPVQSSGNNDVSGVVSGFVYDQWNRPLARAQVLLRSSDSPVSMRTVNRNGFFSFLAVLPGTYVVETRLNGYGTTESCAFTIHPNQIKSLHLQMSNTVKTISHITVWRFQQCPVADPMISF